MTKNLKIFTAIVVLGTAAYLAIGDAITLLPQTAQTIAGFSMLILFFWLVFNFIYRVIYRLVGVTDKLMFKGWTQGWPRLTHQQADEVSKYWLVWLSGSLATYLAYTLLFHRAEWKSAIIFGLAVATIIALGRLSSRSKIGGHSKEEIFK